MCSFLLIGQEAKVLLFCGNGWEIRRLVVVIGCVDHVSAAFREKGFPFIAVAVLLEPIKMIWPANRERLNHGIFFFIKCYLSDDNAPHLYPPP